MMNSVNMNGVLIGRKRYDELLRREAEAKKALEELHQANERHDALLQDSRELYNTNNALQAIAKQALDDLDTTRQELVDTLRKHYKTNETNIELLNISASAIDGLTTTLDEVRHRMNSLAAANEAMKTELCEIAAIAGHASAVDGVRYLASYADAVRDAYDDAEAALEEQSFSLEAERAEVKVLREFNANHTAERGKIARLVGYAPAHAVDGVSALVDLVQRLRDENAELFDRVQTAENTVKHLDTIVGVQAAELAGNRIAVKAQPFSDSDREAQGLKPFTGALPPHTPGDNSVKVTAPEAPEVHVTFHRLAHKVPLGADISEEELQFIKKMVKEAFLFRLD